jgi:hypothetical protein
VRRLEAHVGIEPLGDEIDGLIVEHRLQQHTWMLRGMGRGDATEKILPGQYRHALSRPRNGASGAPISCPSRPAARWRPASV